MKEPDTGALNDPGAYGALLDALGRRPGEIARALQGLLIHETFGAHLYGTPPRAFHDADRATRDVAARLKQIATPQIATPMPRPPFERTVVTCRDFALLMTAALRRRGHAARVRCGFADYLTPGARGEPWFEDHWLCEYRQAPGAPWRLADAQLDPEHRAALGIDFAIDDVPRARFLTADAAWRAARGGGVGPRRFGHGREACGLWFLAVNLRRDRMARFDRIVSPWDRWRAADASGRHLSAREIARCDALSADRRLTVRDAPPWGPGRIGGPGRLGG